MARVSDWFPDFVFAHMSRCPREDWPQLGAEEGNLFWDAIRSNLVKIGATHEHATEASVAVAGDAPRWLNEHPKALLDSIKRVREERSDIGQPGAPKTRAEVEKACRDCLDCQGNGLASRVVGGCRVAFLCHCPMGDWIRSQHGRDCPFVDLPPEHREQAA